MPIPIQLQACNQDFLRMNKMNLIKGKMPTNQQEIIVEEWVLQNLGTDMDIGHTIIFDGKQYMIVGLLSDMKDIGYERYRIDFICKID